MVTDTEPLANPRPSDLGEPLPPKQLKPRDPSAAEDPNKTVAGDLVPRFGEREQHCYRSPMLQSSDKPGEGPDGLRFAHLIFWYGDFHSDLPPYGDCTPRCPLAICLDSKRPFLKKNRGRQQRESAPRAAILPQIRAFEFKGKLSRPSVNPQRGMGCAPLMPEYSFTLDHCRGLEIWAAWVGAPSRKRTDREERGNPARRDDTQLGYSTIGRMTSQAAELKGGGMRYARYGGKFIRRRRSWKRGSERRKWSSGALFS